VRYAATHPSADLAAFIECVWELEDAGKPLSEPIFPDGRIEIVVHLGDRPVMAHASAPQPDVMVAGQMTAALRLRPVSRLHAVGIRFTPAGARAWLGAPVHELTDCVLGLDDVSRDLTIRIRDAVHGGITSRDRAARLERVLRATIQLRRPLSRSVHEAVRLTLTRSGRITVDALARACEISTRQLERQYLDFVGLRPKTFARTVRFQRALRDLQRGVAAATAAAESGFADQSHLAREFRRIAGAPASGIDLAHVAFIQDNATCAAAD
jgi:AraC-like DNA-binding protein